MHLKEKALVTTWRPARVRALRARAFERCFSGYGCVATPTTSDGETADQAVKNGRWGRGSRARARRPLVFFGPMLREGDEVANTAFLSPESGPLTGGTTARACNYPHKLTYRPLPHSA